MTTSRSIMGLIISIPFTIHLAHPQEHRTLNFLEKTWQNAALFSKEMYRGFTETFTIGATVIGATAVGGAALSKMDSDIVTSKVYLQKTMANAFNGVAALTFARSAGTASGLLTPEIKPIFYTKDVTGKISLKSELVLAPAAPQVNIEGPAAELLEQFKNKIFTIAESEGSFANGNDPSNPKVVGALLYGTPGVGKTLAGQVLARDLASVTAQLTNAWYKGKTPVIFRVTQSQITNPFVGMSNKLRDRIQTDMKELSEAGYLPILLFDEADQFFATTGKYALSSEEHQTSGWKDRLEKDLSRYAIIMAASNKPDLDQAIKDRFAFSQNVSPKNKDEWSKIINTSAENIIQGEFSEEAQLSSLKAFLRTKAVNFAEGLPADADEKEQRTEMGKLATPRKFNDSFSEVVKATLKIAREYSEMGIPLAVSTSSSKQEVGQSDTGSTKILENIYDRVLAEKVLSKTLPNQAIRQHIQQKLSEKNPKTAPSVLMKQSRDLAYLIDWAVKDSTDSVTLGKKLFDESFSPIVHGNNPNDGAIYDTEDPLLPTILTIVAKSGKAFETKDSLSPVKTLISAYHGMPGETDALDMAKNLRLIPHIEAAEHGTPEKFLENKKSVRDSIITSETALTALAGLKIGNIKDEYKKVVPGSQDKRKLTAPLYQTSSTLTTQDVANFYKSATGNPKLIFNNKDSNSLN